MSRKRIILFVLAGLLAVGIIAPLTLVWVYTRDLPTLGNLSDYHPNEVSRVYSDDGQLIAQFYLERRTVVGKDKIPKHVLQAFIAAEDGNFYQHSGLDYLGLLRAFIRGVERGGHFRGTSTITQQLVKTLVTGPERSLRRKVREAVLSKRVEEQLSKDDIITIYLNQIVFGRGNYGIEEASRAYFGKSVTDLDIAEAAILGGVPKNPEKYNPKGDLAAVKERQLYVLTQMVENGFIDQAAADAAFKKPIGAIKDPYPFLNKAPHFAEVVRRQLEAKYGPDKLYSGGITVYTTVDARLQSAAHGAVRSGLRAIDRRQGYRGPKVRLEGDALAQITPELEKVYADKRAAIMRYRGLKEGDVAAAFAWDLTTLAPEDAQKPERVRDHMTLKALSEGDEYVGIVDDIDGKAETITVNLGGGKARIAKDGYAWARKFNPTQKTPAPKSPGEIARKGDLVLVRIEKIPQPKATQWVATATLSQDPKVEGSLIAIDPHTHFVRAVVGGDSLEGTGLIRSVQSKRQPGSSFKAVVYAAAINARTINNSFICQDAPVTIRDPWTGEAWQPKNYEDNAFEGDLILRRALAKSKNTCSVKIMEKVGIEPVLAMAKQLGIESELPKVLPLALGAGAVTLLELTNAYTTLAAGGKFGEPIFVRKIVGKNGETLEESAPNEGEQRVDPAVNYVVTQLLTAPVQEKEGTAARAQELQRPMAGKTGTSNDTYDALFVGFTPDLAVGVWTGFDEGNTSMGPETGGKAALPIWMGVMRQAIIDLPNRDFDLPEEGVTLANIDMATGLLAEENAPNSEKLPYLTGTEPQEAASQAIRQDFYDEDDVKKR